LVNIKRNGRTYCLGDNDFYWLFLPDKRGAYVIPETCLYKEKILSEGNKREKANGYTLVHPCKEDVSEFKNGWMNEHLYFFDNKKDINRLYGLFSDMTRPEVEISEEYFTIEKRNRFNTLDKKYVKSVVASVFKKVVERSI
jgi:hypothetical protein